MKLTIKRSDKIDMPGGRGLTGKEYRYWLDDLEVTGALTGLRLRMGVGEVNNSELSFLLEDVEVDAEVLADLQAHIESQELDEAITATRKEATPDG